MVNGPSAAGAAAATSTAQGNQNSLRDIASLVGELLVGDPGIRADHETLRLRLTVHRELRGERSREFRRWRLSGSAPRAAAASASIRIPGERVHAGRRRQG